VKRIRFIAPARREFLSEVGYYNGKEPELGPRFAAAVEEAVMRALAFPLTGSLASKNTRRVFVKNFPFAVVYRSDAEGHRHLCGRPSLAQAGILAVSRSRPLTHASSGRVQSNAPLKHDVSDQEDPELHSKHSIIEAVRYGKGYCGN